MLARGAGSIRRFAVEAYHHVCVDVLFQFRFVLFSAPVALVAARPLHGTVRLRGMGTCISEASKRVPIFSFATQGGKQVSSYF